MSELEKLLDQLEPMDIDEKSERVHIIGWDADMKPYIGTWFRISDVCKDLEVKYKGLKEHVRYGEVLRVLKQLNKSKKFKVVKAKKPESREVYYKITPVAQK